MIYLIASLNYALVIEAYRIVGSWRCCLQTLNCFHGDSPRFGRNVRALLKDAGLAEQLKTVKKGIFGVDYACFRTCQVGLNGFRIFRHSFSVGIRSHVYGSL
jgi:hypothetical protein